ncbi:hypothetical protein EON65_53175 [archaeon]|nr:MAG: hypothetical protein EON65_53175 [archaeon]
MKPAKIQLQRSRPKPKSISERDKLAKESEDHGNVVGLASARQKAKISASKVKEGSFLPSLFSLLKT